jgi:hypothetical protein
MMPWSIGGNYDRPLPRRIGESAGGPRACFGQLKKAVGQPFNGVLPESRRLAALVADLGHHACAIVGPSATTLSAGIYVGPCDILAPLSSGDVGEYLIPIYRELWTCR